MRFGGMDEIAELNAVLDKDDGHGVAHEIHVAFVGVELHPEAAHIPVSAEPREPKTAEKRTDTEVYLLWWPENTALVAEAALP
jgi:hypothetical protein